VKPSVLVDTTVLVDFLRGRPKAVAWVTQRAGEIALSVIVLAELFAGVRGEKERRQLERLKELFPVLDVTAAVAQEGGELRRRFGPPHGTGLADALIAATAMRHDLELATLNVRHFPMFAGLEPAYRRA
jgi:predicted nucleic acid-binding protein